MIIKEIKDFKFEIEDLLKKNFDCDLEANFKPCLEKNLLKTGVLISLAKKIRCSPKEILSKISDTNLSWSFYEEQGFLYLTPKKPFAYSPLSIDTKFFLDSKLVEYYFIPNTVLQEISILRVKALFYILFKVRETFGLKTLLYLPNSASNFEKIDSLNQIREHNFEGLYFFAKNDEEICVDSDNFSKKIVFSVKDGCNVAYQLGSKLNADSIFLPRCFLTKHDFIEDINPLKSNFINKPEASSLYLCKNIANNDLDVSVINSNEQVNILALVKSTYLLLKNINFPSLIPEDSKHYSKFEEELQIASLRVVLFLERAIFFGEAYELVAAIDNYLVLFQKFYNSPEIRQKIIKNRLNYYELSIITSVFELIKLCHTKLDIF